ncbi:MAG: matrixin family metalloprotease [Planctomycetes bacterium]|nr:matrixin family metalloprotease [Planctomycetota bacterium]
MKNLNRLLALSGLTVAGLAVAALSAPVGTAAFATIGGSLGQSQRDFRVFNNFTDTQANNNTTPHSSFPGHTGAVMAIWKGHVEWASEPFAGTGAGDGLSSNLVLGSGGANFDNTFQGTHTSAGGNSSNVHSELAGSSGSTLAFMQGPISDGWTIKYYETWTWQDGPNSVSSGVDLQGVATHEIGHSLGLDHTGVSGSTMLPSISGTGTGQRSIESDDIAGVQFIYGVKATDKPKITALAGSKSIGQTLVINGSNFSSTGNEVWFTKLASDGVAVKVTGVASTGSGTQISVTVPSGIQDGEVMVKRSGSGFADLSNAWPIDVGAGSGDPPLVTSIDPTMGPAGGFTSVTITGTGFSDATGVSFEATPAVSFTVNSNTSITAVSPPAALFTFADVTVTDPSGSSSLVNAFFYTFNPPIDVDTCTPSSGATAGGTTVSITGPSTVGITSVEFDGIPGTNFGAISATEVVVDTPAHAAGTVNVTVNGGADTIVGGFTFSGTGSFIDIGPGLAGVSGVPLLTGAGDLTPGSGTGFTLDVANGNPLAAGTLFVSLTQGAAPFKGGTLYTIPILAQIGVATNLFGALSLPAVIPVGIPSGTSFVTQVWLTDPAAVKGASATNGLKVVTP